MVHIWNEVVEDGEAFPQEEFLDDKTGVEFFAAQTYCGVADNNGKIVGLYILHPNNIGRCGHIANSSYAVDSAYRGQHIGEKLVSDCLVQAKTINSSAASPISFFSPSSAGVSAVIASNRANVEAFIKSVLLLFGRRLLIRVVCRPLSKFFDKNRRSPSASASASHNRRR